MKVYMCADMKAKHTNKQKSCAFADLMCIFSENSSFIEIYSLRLNVVQDTSVVWDTKCCTA